MKYPVADASRKNTKNRATTLSSFFPPPGTTSSFRTPVFEFFGNLFSAAPSGPVFRKDCIESFLEPIYNLASAMPSAKTSIIYLYPAWKKGFFLNFHMINLLRQRLALKQNIILMAQVLGTGILRNNQYYLYQKNNWIPVVCLKTKRWDDIIAVIRKIKDCWKEAQNDLFFISTANKQ